MARVLRDAVKRGMISSNPAEDRDLRLKVSHRKGNFLEADELISLVHAGGIIGQPASDETLARAERAREMRQNGRTWKEIAAELGTSESTAIWVAGRQPANQSTSVRRAILATLGCAGLRNNEVCELNVRDLDFAHGVIHVRDSKTEAGVRQVNMTPWLRDELLTYRATRTDAKPEEPAFPTRTGARRDRQNIGRRVIAPAVKAANTSRKKQRQPALPESITAHTFRRTFITLMLEAGAPVPYVPAQVGHEDPKTTLEIYAQVLRRRDRRKHGEAFDALMSDAIPASANAVPSASSVMMAGDHATDPSRASEQMPADARLFGHRNDEP